MDLWPRHPATGADRRHHLAAAHLVTAFDQKALGVTIGRHPSVGVFDQKQVSETAETGAGIGDDAVFRRLDRGAARRRDVDPIIVQPSPARARRRRSSPARAPADGANHRRPGRARADRQGGAGRHRQTQ